jgi:NAD(P)-dependent dehydrogenase (short-subunit alcohol dehydrogenase family)
VRGPGEVGGVEVLVTAAARPGGAPAPALADLTDDEMRDQFETKVLGYLRCARAVAPHMVAQGWGRIVNISGLNARLATSIAGSVRNVAVAALTKNLADQLGPSGVGVTVVHPGMTVTERTQALFAAQAEREGVAPEQVTARYAAATSIGRLVTAQEVADVVVFLCSPRSVAVTGDAVAVGGGSPGAIHY